MVSRFYKSKAIYVFFPHFYSWLPVTLLPSTGYQGSFHSCFHYGESYRMEQSVSDVHLSGDGHCFSSHRQNGYPVSISSGPASGESHTRLGGVCPALTSLSYGTPQVGLRAAPQRGCLLLRVGLCQTRKRRLTPPSGCTALPANSWNGRYGAGVSGPE